MSSSSRRGSGNAKGKGKLLNSLNPFRRSHNRPSGIVIGENNDNQYYEGDLSSPDPKTQPGKSRRTRSEMEYEDPQVAADRAYAEQLEAAEANDAARQVEDTIDLDDDMDEHENGGLEDERGADKLKKVFATPKKGNIKSDIFKI